MSENAQINPNDAVDQAVAEGGAYEVLKKRLADQGRRLEGMADALNAQRLSTFGDSRMEIAGRMRIRSEHNAVGRDIVQVGGMLLFGYNVFLGLKTTTSVRDVFGLYRLVEAGDGYDVTPVDLAGTFLDEPAFVQDFNELYAYYKQARLTQIMVKDGKLLAAFQIGEKITDVRVFRWSVSSTGDVAYMDARGERDILPPPAFDFEWTRATKDMEVSGRHPHLNILDTLFVETSGGDLTIKVENNTNTGKGVYSEPVEDRTQSIDDAQFEFARVGQLILLKILPYRETQWRGLVYNTTTGKVTRVDAIVQACVQLPEDHGIIFPGGYYLQNGEHKAFDASMANMAYKRSIRSPNGEDVLYVFYNRNTGTSALLVYNMVRRSLAPPILAHGYARLGDGRMVLFQAESEEPTRVHQMQVWNTPFFSDEYAAQAPAPTTELGRIGNAELVRSVSDLYELASDIARDQVSAARYQALAIGARRMFDAHHWIDNGPVEGLGALLHEVAGTSEQVLDEFEKVVQIRQHSDVALNEAREKHSTLIGRMQPEAWTETQAFVDALNDITALRGHLLTIADYRYIDKAAIEAMGQELAQAHETVAQATAAFLAKPAALAPLETRLGTLDKEAGEATTAAQLSGKLKAMGQMSADLDMLSELMATLKVDDATVRTRIVEALGNLYARLNQAKARADGRRKQLGSTEAVAQFGAQFALFSQSIASALALANTPEKADEQLSRLMVQLEELESQFGEHDQFLADILTKREELVEAFEGHKQALADDRQRKAQAVVDAAARILEGLSRRTDRLETQDALNAFFVSDALILKLRELAGRLRELKDTVRADDIEAKLKAAKDAAVRALRDRSDLFEEGGAVIKLGSRHKFSVNTQPLDLTLLPREDHLALHLTGTSFMAPIVDAELDGLRRFWSAALPSESDTLYRGEYLAGQIFFAAVEGRQDWALEGLRGLATDSDALGKRVRLHAEANYRDGYEKGIHDHDATLILQALVKLHQQAGPLVHAPEARAMALDFWAHQDAQTRAGWTARLDAARAIDGLGGDQSASNSARQALAAAIEGTLRGQGRTFPLPGAHAQAAADYLDACLAQGPRLAVSAGARALADALARAMREEQKALGAALSQLSQDPDAALALAVQATTALAKTGPFAEHAHFASEAAALALYEAKVETDAKRVELSARVEGLLGQHGRIQEGQMALAIDEALVRIEQHMTGFVPGWQRYQAARSALLETRRKQMKLSEFKAKPLTSFVRNQLINEVYLPVIGDNLAKQMGTVGENKRSDLMGLLMMISPPGYGKTTLMEYVASRLGLVFMKINGPALGHEVRSLDPAQAPDATSRQELEKLNLALEMGNNVMLYVDDIQHTHPEFLQKFISLCDGTRRIEGVWEGQTKTYDMRGRKFAVVMAGNPYTESGEVFKIPDMLANRADIYNLGDVLGGMEAAFLTSYIENSLTSNPVLAPMATREMSDLYLLLDKAAGKEVSTNTLSHAYSGAEINEIVSVLQRLMQVRDVVYRVNQQYIASAAQDDRYRVEPPFKLQGSYRNMNKLTEKISPAMNAAEIDQLISDHYLGESQLLTTGAEENLLKLAELRGNLTEAQAARWAQIKADFLRNKGMGGDEADTGQRMVAQLADIAQGLKGLEQVRASAPALQPQMPARDEALVAEQQARWEQLLDLVGQALGRPVSVTVEQAAREVAVGQAQEAVPAQASVAGNSEAIAQAVLKLAETQAPLLASLEGSRQMQEAISSGLVAVMERVAASTPSSRVTKKQMTDFERALLALKFREPGQK